MKNKWIVYIVLALVIVSGILVFSNVKKKKQLTESGIVATSKKGNVTEEDVKNYLDTLKRSFGQTLVYEDLKTEEKKLIVSDIINNRLIAEEAKKSDLANSEEFKERLKKAKEDLLKDMYLQDLIAKNIYDGDIKSKYEELVKALEEVKALDLTDYTEETINILKEAIAKGEETLTSKDQTVIDEAVKAIKDAVSALTKKTDFTSLEEAINQNSDLNELHYFKDAITSHKALIEEGKKVLANKEATQEEVDSILNKINESSKNLVVRENKVELEKKINEAKEIKSEGYQTVRWENFLYGIRYASDIYNNPDSSDQEVSSALFTLEYFKSELK